MKISKLSMIVIFTTLILFSLVQAQRITVKGNKFLVAENPIFMLGANTPWDKWNDFGHTFNASWWDNHFKTMHELGLNCTRVWISCDGANKSPGIDAKGAITAPTEKFWSDVGELFKIAQKNRIYLMIALISFDQTKEGNPNATVWRAMYKSAQNRQSFADNYAAPFVKKFGSNPYFWSIDVGNELDWVHENDGVAISDVFDLVARVANAVHSNSEVLVTLGTGAGPKYLSPTYGINYYSDEELQKLQPGAYLDFYNNHYYDWMKEWFSTPFENGPQSWKIDEKPCVIGEYGAMGHGSEYNPAQCLQKAVALGWQGVMPWTSNGVDVNGSLSNFGSAFKTWSDANNSLVFPSLVENPGPFTLTITPSKGGTITVSPQEQYNKGDKVTLTAVPAEGNELVKWTGDGSGATNTIVLTMTRNMSVSALFATAGEFIQNGGFDDGETSWTLGNYEGGAATANTSNKDYQISITSAGTEIWHVQVLQAAIPLEANKVYVLSFDASATSERSTFVAVGEAGGTYDKYLEQTVTFGTTMQHFSYTFTPTVTTKNARVEFNIGNVTTGVTLDNVSLKFAGSSVVQRRAHGSTIRNVAMSYNASSGILHFQGVQKYMRLEGFTSNGKRIFSMNTNNTEENISLPLLDRAPKMIIVRGTVDGIIQFTQKVLCRE